MKRSTCTTGRLGEDAACKYLEGLGHTILERNYRSSHLETDIISLSSDGIHFVEVKSRVAPVAADPTVNVTATKQKRLVAAALRYLNGFQSRRPKDKEYEVFFDVITVVFDKNDTVIQYYPAAFIPLYF